MRSLTHSMLRLRGLIVLQIIGAFLGFSTTLIFSVDELHLPGHVSLTADGEKFTLALFCLAAVNFLSPLLVRIFHLPVIWPLLVMMTTAVNALSFWAIGHWTGGYEVAGWLPLIASPLLMGLVTGTFAWLTARSL